jgi:hypothetical protein
MPEIEPSFNPLFDAPPGSEVPPPQAAPVDPGQIREYRELLLAQQNIHRGIAGGFASALIGAGAWAVVTVTTGFQHEVMSIGIGLLVGLAVRKYGHGISPPFGVAGALLALFGSLLGNVLSYGAQVALAAGLPVIQYEFKLITNPLAAGQALASSFSIFDLAFYGVALIAGYNLSFRQVADSAIARMILAHEEEEPFDV